MSFFKDFKEDLSQAVNDLMPDEKTAEQTPQMVDTITETAQPQQEADELASLLAALDTDIVNEEIAKAAEAKETASFEVPVYTEAAVSEPETIAAEPAANFAEPEAADQIASVPVFEETPAEPEKVPVAPIFAPEPEPEVVVKKPVEPIFAPETSERPAPINTTEATMSVGIIPEGMTIVGDITSDGSIDIRGTVKGNITIAGKLNITGVVEGNSKADEVFADGAKIIGEISSQHTVKIGDSSVIKGNIEATSAVLAGAVKGDIDVKGPVVLDATAIIMGNIKSKSIQINNGAAIEGLCSQCYAEVSPATFFTEE